MNRGNAMSEEEYRGWVAITKPYHPYNADVIVDVVRVQNENEYMKLDDTLCKPTTKHKAIRIALYRICETLAENFKEPDVVAACAGRLHYLLFLLDNKIKIEVKK